MKDMTLTSEPETPAGMIRTACGRLVPDTGHGRLLALLDEAFELHNEHVNVTVGGITSRFPLSHDLPAGDVELAPGLTASDGATETLGRRSVDGRATAEVLVDGHDATLGWDDHHSLPHMVHEK